MIIVTGFTDLSAEAHRNQTATLLATTATLDSRGTPQGLQVYGGVHSGFDFAKTGAMTGTVAAGRAVIPATDSTQGAYVVTMTEPESFTLEPGDGVYTRRDLVCLKIDDVPVVDPEDPDPPVVSGASIFVVKGAGVTGTTTPTIPATPANAIPLWAFQVSPTMNETNGGYSPTSNIFDMRLRLKLANQDRQPFSMAAGQQNVNMSATKNWGMSSISFPAGRFRVGPIVTASMANAPGGSANLVPRAINVTPTGCSIYVYTGDDTVAANVPVLVNWIAVQMAEDGAVG